MDEEAVFFKTEKGQEEIARPGGSLSARLRRCLILVDGTKTVAELAAAFRAGEIGPILKELRAAGYIEGDATRGELPDRPGPNGSG